MERIAVLLCGFLLYGIAPAETLTGRVVSISDGDTLIIVLDHRLQQHKFRLAGIDSPEKAQPFGNRSKQYLSELYPKDVDVEWRKYDRYGRIGKIMVAAPNSCPAVQRNCPEIWM